LTLIRLVLAQSPQVLLDVLGSIQCAGADVLLCDIRYDAGVGLLELLGIILTDDVAVLIKLDTKELLPRGTLDKPFKGRNRELLRAELVPYLCRYRDDMRELYHRVGAQIVPNLADGHLNLAGHVFNRQVSVDERPEILCLLSRRPRLDDVTRVPG